MAWQDVPLGYLGDEDGWRKWCAYADAITRVSKIRALSGTRLGSMDRFWWAERDYQRKRLEHLTHNGD